MAFEMKKKKKNLDALLGMARSEKKKSSWALEVSLWKISGSNSIFSIKKKKKIIGQFFGPQQTRNSHQVLTFKVVFINSFESYVFIPVSMNVNVSLQL